MKLKIKAALLVSLLYCLSPNSWAQVISAVPETAPKWSIEQLASIQKTDEPVDYLLFQQVSDYRGEVKYFNRLAQRVNSSSALGNVGEIELHYHPQYQHIELHELLIVRDGQILPRQDQSRINEVNVEQERDLSLYSQQKAVLISVSDLRRDDILLYSYSITGSNPVFGRHVSADFQVGWEVPLAIYDHEIFAERTLNLEISDNNYLQQFGSLLQVSNVANNKHWRLSLRQLPVTRAEGNNSYADRVYPFLQISSFDDWQQVSVWAQAHFNEELQKSKGENLWQPLGNTPRHPSAVLSWIQENIRYVGVEVGVNSHRPHNPTQVMQQRYGDCKDVSLLLTALLRDIGISAEPVLVSTWWRDGLAQALPGYVSFDHVITRIEYDDRVWYVDPTNQYQYAAALDDLGYTSFGYALPTLNPELGLQKMPEERAENSLIQGHTRLGVLAPNAAGTLEFTTHFYGKEAERVRAQWDQGGRQEMSDNLMNFYARYFNHVRPILPLQWQDDRQLNQVTLSQSYLIDDLWFSDDDGFFLQWFAEEISPYLSMDVQARRKQDLWLGPKRRVEQVVDVYYPSIMALEILPLDEVYADQNRSLKVTGRDFGYRFQYDFVYETANSLLKASDYNAHRKLLDDLNDALDVYGSLYGHEAQHYSRYQELTHALSDSLEAASE